MTPTSIDPHQRERPDLPRTGVRPRRALVTLLLVGLAGLVLLAAMTELLARDREGSSAGITVANFRAVAESDGRRAPAFTLPSLDGSDIHLSERPGQVIVLNFWASWCAPCRVEASDLQGVWDRYRDRGVRFIGVDYLDDDASGRAFVDEFAVTYPSAVDQAGSLASEYEVIGVPTTFVISPDGTIVFRFTGRIDAAVLSRALDDVLDPATPMAPDP